MVLNFKDRKWHRMKYWHLMHEYPVNIHLLPLDKKNDVMIFTYKAGQIKFGVFNYSTLELTEKSITR